MELEKLRNGIDREQALSFLKALVRVNSVNPPGNESEVAALIEEKMRRSPLTIQRSPLADNRENILVSLKNADARDDADKKHLIFSGHLDTVPIGNQKWDDNPWGAAEKEGKLFGRGTSDMKSGVAAMLIAMEQIAASGLKLAGDLSFLGTAGEEVDGQGASLAIQEQAVQSATAMVIGEPTNNQLCIAHKGVLWLEVIINGKTAHAGWPDKGISAISAMNEFINAFKIDHPVSDPLLGHATLNLGVIKGGIAPNMVADSCQLTVDFRTVPGIEAQNVYAQAKQILTALSEKLQITYEVNVLNNMHYVSTSPSDPFIQLSANILSQTMNQSSHFGGANYYSDGSKFIEVKPNLPILIFGPGNPDQAHQPNEWVAIDKFYDAIVFYMALALEYLGVSQEN
ncbi:M20 family metallopeptidase [Sporolactobacillus spathodeae]|uniref:Succinyl-diaminopimelate desuccinylase n=1 Tax=Sporolactobacillus spathodeae TaxID=1465502 RepID=A0ABS2Q7G8_9BACL|nr:M20 family metallopeptidase [Sporolactobacillus spathodeae]MBM7657734.1 succinyl-diaminopimelate desuccinylase [Sporolactobacillus spathodeae]